MSRTGVVEPSEQLLRAQAEWDAVETIQPGEQSLFFFFLFFRIVLNCRPAKLNQMSSGINLGFNRDNLVYDVSFSAFNFILFATLIKTHLKYLY